MKTALERCNESTFFYDSEFEFDNAICGSDSVNIEENYFMCRKTTRSISTVRFMLKTGHCRSVISLLSRS